MRLKSVSFKIAVLFLVFTAVFTLFRSSMSGIFSLFYAKNGILDANISSIKSFQNIGIMFGLLPAGYLADKVGRLKVLALSSLIIATSFFILILFRNFFFFSMAELLYGIGLALNSGTLLAYVTDLQEQNKIAPSSKLMGMQVIILNLTILKSVEILVLGYLELKILHRYGSQCWDLCYTQYSFGLWSVSYLFQIIELLIKNKLNVALKILLVF